MEQDAFGYRVDELFNEGIRAFNQDMAAQLIPWDVYEQGDWFWIEASVPGFGGKDVAVAAHDGALTLSLPRRAEEHDEHMLYFVRKLGRDTVNRSMQLPAYVDTHHATATCKDGMLTIGFPKRIEAVGKRVPVEDRLAG